MPEAHVTPPQEQQSFEQVMQRLRGVHENELIHYKVMVSTLETGAGQQARIMKEKDYYIDELETSLYALRLELQSLRDEYNIDTPPEPYPYTNPVRDIPAYSQVRRTVNA